MITINKGWHIVVIIIVSLLFGGIVGYAIGVKTEAPKKPNSELLS